MSEQTNHEIFSSNMDSNANALKQEEARQLEILEQFAKDFKQKRIKLGFTQSDVGTAVGHLYGNNFSQTTISRFEALNLSFKNMCKLKPLLQRWLDVTNDAVVQTKHGTTDRIVYYPSCKETDDAQSRKKRTNFDKKTLDILNRIFAENPKPSSNDLANITALCGLDERIVRVWFYNRRQKQRRIEEQGWRLVDLNETKRTYCDPVAVKDDKSVSNKETTCKVMPPLLPISAARRNLDEQPAGLMFNNNSSVAYPKPFVQSSNKILPNQREQLPSPDTVANPQQRSVCELIDLTIDSNRPFYGKRRRTSSAICSVANSFQTCLPSDNFHPLTVTSIYHVES